MSRRWASAALLALMACGPGDASRAFDLEVRGFSARAEALVIKLRGAELPINCREVTLENVVGLEADEEQRWERSAMAERHLSVEAVESDVVVLVAYAVDAAGAAMQLACSELSFTALGNLSGGRVVLTLSARQ